MVVLQRGLIGIGSLSLLLLIALGCSASYRRPMFEATGATHCRPWIASGPERLYARGLSLDEARRGLWQKLLDEKSGTGQRVEKMTLLYPDFNARLRGLVALAQVQSCEENDGELTISIQLDQQSVQNLIREYTEGY